MKRIFSLLLILVLLVSAIIPSSSVQPAIKVTLDGKTISFDTPPFIENGRTLVPFRAIFEALGAEVRWDESSQTVTGTRNGKNILLKINSSSALVNDSEISLDVPAKVIKDRTFVPTRFIAENLGVRVYWDSIARTVVLLSEAISPEDDQKYISKPVDLTPSTSGRLTFWHFNGDEAPTLEADIKKEFPDLEIDFTVISDKDSMYLNKLIQAVRSGSGIPDVMTAESSMVKRLVNMPDCYYDITDKVGDITGNMYPYTVDVGRDDDGKIRALSHQITSGAIGYKRPVAKKYLGTDDPAEVSRFLQSPQSILDTAKKLKEKSGGKVALFPSWEELKNIYLRSRSQGWVVDNKLYIDSKVPELIDIAKVFRTNKYELGYDSWSSGWSSAIMADETAMCWAIPTWGVPWIIGSNDKKAQYSKRWGLAKATYPYYWGGTWYGVSEASDNKDLALGLVRYLVSNEERMENWYKKTGDIPNSRKLIKQYSDDRNVVDKITNQNHFKVFGDAAENINGRIDTQYDDIMYYTFSNCMRSYLAGKISSKEDLILKFKKEVRNTLKDITVE